MIFLKSAPTCQWWCGVSNELSFKTTFPPQRKSMKTVSSISCGHWYRPGRVVKTAFHSALLYWDGGRHFYSIYHYRFENVFLSFWVKFPLSQPPIFLSYSKDSFYSNTQWLAVILQRALQQIENNWPPAQWSKYSSLTEGKESCEKTKKTTPMMIRGKDRRGLHLKKSSKAHL